MVVGSPAVIMNPGGRVNGLALCCAVARAKREVAM